jgi:hypothetical protein
MAVTRLSGGLTPANGSDPRTFPAIWNATADDIEQAETDIATLQGDVTTLQGDLSGLEINDLADVVIATPADGQVLIYDDGDWVNQALPATGKILQVVQTVKTDIFSTALSTFTTVTGTTATITPSSVSSKILILGTMFVGISDGSGAKSAFVKVVGGNTSAYLGDSAGNRVQAVGTPGAHDGGFYGAAFANGFTSVAYLDSPATTSAVTYNLELRRGPALGTAFIGKSGKDDDSADFGRFPTTIILMEVAG